MINIKQKVSDTFANPPKLSLYTGALLFIANILYDSSKNGLNPLYFILLVVSVATMLLSIYILSNEGSEGSRFTRFIKLALKTAVYITIAVLAAFIIAGIAILIGWSIVGDGQ